jgi:hypothetical protein
LFLGHLDRRDRKTSPEIESTFAALPARERETIIEYGTAMRISALSKRLALAKGQVHAMERKCCATLAEIEERGLPSDGGTEIHEEYILWHHWAEVADSIRTDLKTLEVVSESA